jgi:hypothetical protein
MTPETSGNTGAVEGAGLRENRRAQGRRIGAWLANLLPITNVTQFRRSKDGRKQVALDPEPVVEAERW